MGTAIIGNSVRIGGGSSEDNVKYTPQTPTSEQQTLARTNIGIESMTAEEIAAACAEAWG